MSVDQTRQVVIGFLDSLADHWLAEDVHLYDSARSRHYRGRAEVAARFASSQTAFDQRVLIVDEGYAAVEVASGGTPPGGPARSVTIYQVRAGEIVAARMYHDLAFVWPPLHVVDRYGEDGRGFDV